MPRGMTFVDVVVGVSIMLLVFLAIFGVFKIAIELVYSTKAKAGGMSLVSQQLEYVRGLPYESIGTAGGIPAGPILQLATTTINGIQYITRTLVLYSDAPEDGTGGADTTGVTADYKVIKVETSWSIRGSPRTTYALTRVSPHGVESLTSGGTLRLNVFSALATPLPDASVRIQNASTSPAIDFTIDSDNAGTVLVPGAPPASGYKITVTKSGYSTAATYDVSAQNPNPNPGHLAVANQQTTTASFFIDRTGTLRVSTFSPTATGFFSDDFVNQTQLISTTSTTVSGGALTLVDGSSSGDAYSTTIAPSKLASWDNLSWNTATPSGTTASVQLYYLSAGQYVLVPDGVLAGNSTGLTSGSVPLSALATSTFPSLRIKGTLATNDASTTPTITDWQLDYHAGPTPLPNIGMTVRGDKSIGASVSGTSVYKYSQVITTDQYGEWTLTPIEWDSYTLTLSGTTYDIGEQCPYPLAVLPGEDRSVTLELVSHSTNTVRPVVTAAGAPLGGATVAISGSTNATTTTSSCGQAIFSSLTSGTYTLSVSKTGYQPSSQQISVSGTTVVPVALVP